MKEITRRRILEIAGGDRRLIQIVKSLTIFKDWEYMVEFLHRKGISQNRLLEFYEEAGATPLSLGNEIARRSKGLMFRPIQLQDMVQNVDNRNGAH